MTHELLIPPVDGLRAIRLSIGIIVRNEEEAITPALQSLFRQTLFEELAAHGEACEIICVANGCTDQTVPAATRVFVEQEAKHPKAKSFQWRMEVLPEAGKINAINYFVHRFSSPEADYLFLMDGDIVLHSPTTLWNMCCALETNETASIATDEPLKDIYLSKCKSLRQRISLATSRMTQSRPAQVTGQLYCIRATVARNLYLPRNLAACEDGFVKTLVCTDFLTREVVPGRVIKAKDASHIFQAYTSLLDIVRNQKRQMIGQTVVHLLVDNYLKELPLDQRLKLGETLREKDAFDPDWLRRLIHEHMTRTRFFWQLFPDALSYPFHRLLGMHGFQRLRYVPAALVGFVLTVWSCSLAYRFLKQGYGSYWPDTKSPRLQELQPENQTTLVT